MSFLPAAVFEVSKLTGFEIACIRWWLLLSSLSLSPFNLLLIEIVNLQKQEVHLSNIMTSTAYVTENAVHFCFRERSANAI